jgi:ATP-dependent helicase/nuclease subunit B
MRVRLLFGPAGSGKTRRCLDEIRAALAAAPEGPPLLFLAPKQATFQIERQLLADPALAGFTRLHILSLDRLAVRVLRELGRPAPELLAEEGRLMVLRALLHTHREQLQIFRASARLAGFAAELSRLLRLFQHHRVAPGQLAELARAPALSAPLRGKLADLALLLGAYQQWLEAHGLQDAEVLPDTAAAALRSARGEFPPALRFAGLWLDGFAEMTPQEIELLAALLPAGEQATLAFCLEAPPPDETHWLSPWTPVSDTVRRLQARLAELPGCAVEIETLPRAADRGRFAASPALQHLEAHWAAPRPFAGDPAPAVRVFECGDPEQEVVLAAREILRFVRETGARFRETAVLLRRLEGYPELIRRVFRRYEIPFFLDRRESVAHHPLAELTRSALRTVAFDWRHADWFSALKTGLVSRQTAALDRLENEALARGWQGPLWREPLVISEQPDLAARLEALRAQIVPPFERLARDLTGTPPSGSELAEALARFWEALGVEAELARWAEAAPAPADNTAPAGAVHRTVWEQMQLWLENLRLAFPTERWPLRDWLPVLEAGLARLTVGVIPPALDQVLVGAVDRSRNPDLRLVIAPGFNEGVFPAVPAAPPLLSDLEQRELGAQGLDLGADRCRGLGRERYLGYITCTRASERLVLTYARADFTGRPLGPSPWLSRLQQLYPKLVIEPARAPTDAADVLHPREIFQAGLRPEVAAAPELARCWEAAGWTTEAVARWRAAAAETELRLAPALAARLYGPGGVRVSVSKLEQFAACPFRFFVAVGLRADERRRFEVDARQRGSFQHEVLRRFHDSARAAGRRWRDFTPEAAREHVGEIARAVAAEFGGGLFEADEAGVLSAETLTAQLQDFVAAVVAWMHAGNAFDPVAAELAFGGADGALPAWTLPLPAGGELRLSGQVDRVDVAPAPGGVWCVVHDYKSSAHVFDPVLFEHGIQLQLPAYLAAVCAVGLPAGALGAGNVPALAGPLRPAGFFYVNLRGQFASGASRRAVLGVPPEQLRAAYQHRGRFSRAAWEALGADPNDGGAGQFLFKLRQDGKLAARGNDALEPGDFALLLARLREKLVELAGRILAGEAAVDPYQKNSSQKACTQCGFAAICRIDPWTHRFRRLPKAMPTPTPGTA